MIITSQHPMVYKHLHIQHRKIPDSETPTCSSFLLEIHAPGSYPELFRLLVVAGDGTPHLAPQKAFKMNPKHKTAGSHFGGVDFKRRVTSLP